MVRNRLATDSKMGERERKKTEIGMVGMGIRNNRNEKYRNKRQKGIKQIKQKEIKKTKENIKRKNKEMKRK